ncbi:hypothetical protein [Sphingomonas sp. MS122]|uniref:hypothetical protein n=1 Tax=Sphingomonas sp. MS122 TaxID=3412683 RepID=UPI003C2BF98D
MDFTYWIAFALSLLVGLVTAFALVAAGKQPTRKHYRRIVASVVAIDCLLLINWSAITLEESWILAVDLVFFTIYGALGAAIGMFPAIVVGAIVRRLRR